MYVILAKGYMQSNTQLAEGFCYSQGTNILLNGFIACIKVERCNKVSS